MTLFRTSLLSLGALLLAGCGQKAPEPSPAPPAATPTPAPAATRTYDGQPKPALWKIQDADTTVYFFGTVHLLPEGVTWRTPALDQALTASKALYLETNIDVPLAELTPIVSRLGNLPPGKQLSDFLTAEQTATLTAAATKVGVPMPALQMFRPWFAATLITQTVIEGSGFRSDLGVETILSADAKAAGKEFRYLETLEEQLGALAGLPDAVQVQFLMTGLDELDKAVELLGEMVAAWRSGNDAEVDRLMNDAGEAEAIPEVNEALLVRRNANWAPQIDALMDTETGTFLVAVGAAHLAGPDSVLEMLKPMGHTPVRVQ